MSSSSYVPSSIPQTRIRIFPNETCPVSQERGPAWSLRGVPSELFGPLTVFDLAYTEEARTRTLSRSNDLEAAFTVDLLLKYRKAAHRSGWPVKADWCKQAGFEQFSICFCATLETICFLPCSAETNFV